MHLHQLTSKNIISDCAMAEKEFVLAEFIGTNAFAPLPKFWVIKNKVKWHDTLGPKQAKAFKQPGVNWTEYKVEIKGNKVFGIVGTRFG